MVLLARLTASLALATSAGAVSLRPLRGQDDASLALPLQLEEGHVPLFVKWEDYLGNDLSNVNFVQVGGNCGTNLPECAVGGDPIWEYATRFGWNGIVVEPVPHIFQQLSYNYETFPSIKPLHCLVSDHTGTGKIVDQAETSHEVSLARTNAVSVDTYTLVDLWAKFFGDKQKVDILVVDAEGDEPKILGEAFPEPKPKLVLFEISSLEPAVLDDVHENLVLNGYQLVAHLKHQDQVGLTMPPQDALYKLNPEEEEVVRG